MPATSRMGWRFAQRRRAMSLRRQPVQRPCQRHHFARSRVRTASWARDASAGPRQGRKFGGHVGQFRGRTRTEIESREALRLTRALTGADEQPSDPDRHVAEQGAECCGIIALAGQRTSTGNAPATPLAHHGHLGRNYLGLERRRELLRSSLSPRSAKPASSPRSMRATSVSVVTPGRSSATSFTRHTSFGTSPPSSREPGT